MRNINKLRPDDVRVLRAIKRGPNTLYLLSKDKKLSMNLSSLEQPTARLLKYGFIEKGKQGVRRKTPFILTVNGELFLANIPTVVIVTLRRENTEEKSSEYQMKDPIQHFREDETGKTSNLYPGSFNGSIISIPIDDIYYRIVKKNNETRVIPVFPGSLSPGFKIENVDTNANFTHEIGTVTGNNGSYSF